MCIIWTHFFDFLHSWNLTFQLPTSKNRHCAKMSNDQNFVNALAQSQSQRNQLAAQGWTEEGARQAARDEAFADLDPHGDEIGFPAHVAA